ncbi:hypothetical protein C0J52_15012 [Blattella germanica]|nr:hypothetical protein C0J52_15012 [Blattella germanica]
MSGLILLLILFVDVHSSVTNVKSAEVGSDFVSPGQSLEGNRVATEHNEPKLRICQLSAFVGVYNLTFGILRTVCGNERITTLHDGKPVASARDQITNMDKGGLSTRAKRSYSDDSTFKYGIFHHYFWNLLKRKIDYISGVRSKRQDRAGWNNNNGSISVGDGYNRPNYQWWVASYNSTSYEPIALLPDANPNNRNFQWWAASHNSTNYERVAFLPNPNPNQDTSAIKDEPTYSARRSRIRFSSGGNSSSSSSGMTWKEKLGISAGVIFICGLLRLLCCFCCRKEDGQEAENV